VAPARVAGRGAVAAGQLSGGLESSARLRGQVCLDLFPDRAERLDCLRLDRLPCRVPDRDRESDAELDEGGRECVDACLNARSTVNAKLSDEVFLQTS
jgi:hypothetical protein